MANHSAVSDSQYGSGHGTLKSYIIGFLLSLILTIIPFVVVTQHLFTNNVIAITITIAAVLQLFVQLVFFLHLSTESKPRWNSIAFAFTTLIVAILVIGSLWIMYNLNYNMMDH